MKVETESVTLQGHQLHRLILRPEGVSKASLVFFHGQGDYIDRYPPLLEVFVKHGLTCILTDMPGHGRSSGKRGHVPGFPFADALLEDSLTTVPGPHGIAGHSMGGLLALRALLANPARFHFAWFSSPLLAPARQGPPLMRILLPLAATLAPWITWSTGVTSEQCQPGGKEERDPEALHHSRISLGWAHQLVRAAAELEEHFLTLPLGMPILFTQGGADPICPPDLLRQHVEKLPQGQVHYREIEDALHEPFAGEQQLKDFQSILDRWLIQ